MTKYTSCSSAAKNGNLECLKYAHENGGTFNENTFQIALENNKHNCIKYLVENDCPRDQYVSIMAATYCDLETIEYLCKNKIVKIDVEIIKHSIHNKKTAVCKYFLDIGYPITYNIMIECAKYDKVNYLKYFQTNHYMTIDQEIFETIIKNDSIKCLKYIYSKLINLYDLYLSNFIYSIAYGNCRKFIRRNLCKKA